MRSRLICLVLAILITFGCTVPKELVPMIAGDQTKVALLQQGISKVGLAFQWKDPLLAAEVVKPTLLPSMLKVALGNHKDTKVYAVTAEDIQFDKPKLGEAEVMFEIQAYGSPTYAVRTVKVNSVWEFSRMDGGWRMNSMEKVENESKQ